MLHFGWGQPAGYYRYWRPSAPRQEETALRDEIQRLSLATRSYGYRRITAQLRQLGFAVNRKRVQRLRAEDNLLCLRKPAFRPVTTQSDHRFKVWPNLARRLLPMAVNQLWVADITYVRLSEAFVYLAVILDAFSRRVIGWALSDRLTAEVALDALAMALSTREIIRGGLVHHSDRGVQYACGDDIARLQQAGIQPSMSRPGCPVGQRPWQKVSCERRSRKRWTANHIATWRTRGRGSGSFWRRCITASACTRPWPIRRRRCSRRPCRLAWRRRADEHDRSRHARCPDLGQHGAVLATVKDAARRLRRWPAAILDRGSARRLGEYRPGRRNGPVQPNKETSLLIKARLNDVPVNDVNECALAFVSHQWGAVQFQLSEPWCLGGLFGG